MQSASASFDMLVVTVRMASVPKMSWVAHRVCVVRIFKENNKSCPTEPGSPLLLSMPSAAKRAKKLADWWHHLQRMAQGKWGCRAHQQ